MIKHTLKILQQMLQDFKSVSDHFGTSCIKGLKSVVYFIIPLSSLPMTSFLSYVVACNFTEKELHHFRTAVKVCQNTV